MPGAPSSFLLLVPKQVLLRKMCFSYLFVVSSPINVAKLWRAEADSVHVGDVSSCSIEPQTSVKATTSFLYSAFRGCLAST